MFNNIGHKIQVLAKVLCWIGIICWVITGLALMAGGSSVTYRLNGEFVRFKVNNKIRIIIQFAKMLFNGSR